MASYYRQSLVSIWSFQPADLLELVDCFDSRRFISIPGLDLLILCLDLELWAGSVAFSA